MAITEGVAEKFEPEIGYKKELRSQPQPVEFRPSDI